MKKLLLFLCLIVAWALLGNSLFRPSSVLIRQSAAVHALDNSNSAYLAQQSAETFFNPPFILLGILLLCVVFYGKQAVTLIRTRNVSKSS